MLMALCIVVSVCRQDSVLSLQVVQEDLSNYAASIKVITTHGEMTVDMPEDADFARQIRDVVRQWGFVNVAQIHGKYMLVRGDAFSTSLKGIVGTNTNCVSEGGLTKCKIS